jgi:hypothetical protein
VFDTKVAVVLRDDLQMWQKLNVASFLVSGVAGGIGGLMGEPYLDADGTTYLPMLRQPIAVLQGSAELLVGARRRALDRGLQTAIYTEDLFDTGNDQDNRAAVRAAAGADLRIVGLAVYGARNAVDKALKGARLHP